MFGVLTGSPAPACHRSPESEWHVLKSLVTAALLVFCTSHPILTQFEKVWEHHSYFSNCSPIVSTKVINTNRSAAVLPEFSPFGRNLGNFAPCWCFNLFHQHWGGMIKQKQQKIPVFSNNSITRQPFSICRETLGLIWIMSVNTLCGLLRHNALNCPLHRFFFK